MWQQECEQPCLGRAWTSTMFLLLEGTGGNIPADEFPWKCPLLFQIIVTPLVHHSLLTAVFGRADEEPHQGRKRRKEGFPKFPL